MVVDIYSGVIAGRPAGVAGLGNDPESCQVFEGSVDGGFGDSRQPALDGLENIVGGGVIVEIEDRFEDRLPLHRTALALFATQPFEQIDPTLFDDVIHESASSVSGLAR